MFGGRGAFLPPLYQAGHTRVGHGYGKYGVTSTRSQDIMCLGRQGSGGLARRKLVLPEVTPNLFYPLSEKRLRG